MNGGTITQNAGRLNTGGGVCVNNGTFTMNGGSISNNYTSAMGGGVYVNNSTFTMNGGSISNNLCYDGGGVCVNNGTFTMNNGEISSNTAESKISNNGYIKDGGGGGIYISTNGIFTMNSGTIKNNKAGVDEYKNNDEIYCPDGGGISSSNSITIEDSSIQNNKAAFVGGGVYAWNFKMVGKSEVCNNTSENGAGGIGLSGTGTIIDGIISNNKTTGQYSNSAGIDLNLSLVSDTNVLNVSGNLIVSNNIKEIDHSINNVYLSKNRIINVIGELGEKANIGVTVEDEPATDGRRKIAEGSNGYTILSGDEKKFTSDNKKYKTTFDSDAVYLGERPDSEKIVTFYYYKGKTKECIVEKDKTVNEPTDTTREGYTLEGWYQNENFTGDKWDFNNNTVEENMILYAKWNDGNTPITPPEDTDEFTITFNTNGGSAVPSQTVKLNEKATKPANPTKLEYIFKGWFTNTNYTQEYDFDTSVTANITLYAKWEENKTTPSTPSKPTLHTTKYYTVTFESNGGSEISSQTIETGKTAVMPENPIKSDCEFLGWFADKNFNEVYRFSTPVTKDITIYAKWKSDNCIVTFETNGGSEISSQTIETGKTAVMPENPIKSGYEFLGWFADKNFNEVYRFSTSVTEDITIYAKWKSKSHSSGGGGSSSGGRTGTWVTEEPKTTQTTIQPLIQPTTQYPAIKQDCPRDETCPLWKFNDVDRWAWYHDGSHYCVEKGLIVGTTNITFSPDMPITRAMVVAILWRIEDKPLVNDVITFKDVNENEYYAEAVRWATHNGIVSGYSSIVFAPDDSITREQMASILYRYTQYKNKDVSGRADISNYQDRNEISNYALTAIQWACNTGIINGISTTILSPKGTTTRAQAAQMFKAYLEEQL